MFESGVQNEADRMYRDRLKKLEAILSGDTTIALHLQFLIRANKADLQILKNTKVLQCISVCVVNPFSVVN